MPPRRGDKLFEVSESTSQGHDKQNQQDQSREAAAHTRSAGIESTPTKQNQQNDQDQQRTHGVRLLRLGLAGKWNGLHQAAETNLVEAGP